MLDQFGNPMPGQRVEWLLSRYPEAVGDIVACDDQYGTGRIAPIAHCIARVLVYLPECTLRQNAATLSMPLACCPTAFSKLDLSSSIPRMMIAS